VFGGGDNVGVALGGEDGEVFCYFLGEVYFEGCLAVLLSFISRVVGGGSG
jgi:hypothetical protein